MSLIFKRLTALIVKDGAAKGSPLKSQESRFLIPNKTHRKAVLLVTGATDQVTAAGVQEAAPCAIRNDLSGTPKDSIATLIVERTIADTETLREDIKATIVVRALVIAYCTCYCGT